MSGIYVGTSGFNYKHWSNGVFYPEDIPQREWLEYYARNFDTVELNVSFYRLPKESVFEGWHERTPTNFIFVVKGSRFITHIKRLKDCKDSIELFFGRAKGLKEKLGVVLWQLPPNFRVDAERLNEFCELLKKNKVAKGTKQVFEFRHDSWFCDKVYEILKTHNFSLCVAHSKCWPCEKVITANYVYMRFHGGEVLYGSNYSDEELKMWASKAQKWLNEGKDIYVYFNNDAYGYAVRNAKKFRELLKS
ncbi:DUF72 domain-containing protein [Candidatus Oleimmundimicrobium sp.]|uniref:DUF72 domain-containing protein n=1 Tax=Candidatus Oleimmundimicrobium sp. TaxID=3060597 RepID=UPI00271CAD30|nr:DUF72 domain-containing protein [Candidatus Oleimmundimicrobium sp.]MDO8886548.1 DUF72 domain-containing protein [Candidatus Oleimmundimicrobium sp.]